MRKEEILDRLTEIIDDLVESNLEVPVVVEGRKDVRSLRRLGLKGEVVRLDHGIPIFNLCEKICAQNSEAIILTDWDRRGGQLARMLREGLEANGAKFDDRIRRRLALVCKKEIKDVESLADYVSRLKKTGRSRGMRV